MPNSTITITQNQIQSRIKPLYKNQLERYKQKGLKPSIFDGNDINRLPRITHNSFAVCSQVGLSEICIPSVLLMLGAHIRKVMTRRFITPVKLIDYRFPSNLHTKAQPLFIGGHNGNFAMQTVSAIPLFILNC